MTPIHLIDGAKFFVGRICTYAAMTCFHGCKGNDELNIFF